MEAWVHTSPWAVPGLALLTVLVALPMVLRKVPPNPFYGFRTPKSMSSPAVWYESNFRAGVNLVWAGAGTLAVWSALALSLGMARAGAVGMTVFCTALVGAVTVSLVQLYSK